MANDEFLSDQAFLVGRKETAWATYSASSDLPHPIYDGAYGVGLNDPDREQPHVDGDLDGTYIVQDIRDLQGNMEVGVFPTLVRALFDWIFKRTAGAAQSYTWDFVLNDMVALRHLGCMVNTATFNFQEGQDLRISMDVRGKYETLRTPIPAVASFSFPQTTSMYFANCRFLLSIDDLATEIVPVGFESGTIQVNNQLQPGPHMENRVDVQKDATIDYLRAGKMQITGSYTVLLDRADYLLMQRSKLKGSLRLMMAHRGGDSLIVDTAGASAGTLVSVPVTASPVADFPAGTVVRFDTATAANTSVAEVSSSGTGPNQITVDVLDKDVVAGDYIFSQAAELYLPRILVTSITRASPKGQLVKCTINFKAAAESGSSLVTYHAEE